MADDDMLDEDVAEIPEDEDDGLDLEKDEDEEGGEVDELDPKHLSSLGFGIEEEDF